MRLFLEKGFEATTVEEIAAAAGVSHMTVFRHFPTKEALIFSDRFDPIMEKAIRHRPATESAIDSIMNVVIDLMSSIPDHEYELARQRSRMIYAIPSLRAGLVEHNLASVEVIVQALHDRGGFPAGSPLPAMAARMAMAIMTEVIGQWLSDDAPTPGNLIREAFALARSAFDPPNPPGE